MKRVKKILKSEKGIGLITVLLILVVLSILASTLVVLTQTGVIQSFFLAKYRKTFALAERCREYVISYLPETGGLSLDTLGRAYVSVEEGGFNIFMKGTEKDVIGLTGYLITFDCDCQGVLPLKGDTLKRTVNFGLGTFKGPGHTIY